MIQKTFIGVDPGKNTGFAAWSSKEKKFLEVHSTDFWGAITGILHYSKRIATDSTERLTVVIEATYLNPSMHAKTIGLTKHNPNLTEQSKNAIIGKIAMNVGGNQREAELFVEFCYRHGIEFIAAKPTAKSFTKLKADRFSKLVGWHERTNEHARDAAMLVWGK